MPTCESNQSQPIFWMNIRAKNILSNYHLECMRKFDMNCSNRKSDNNEYTTSLTSTKIVRLQKLSPNNTLRFRCLVVSPLFSRHSILQTFHLGTMTREKKITTTYIHGIHGIHAMNNFFSNLSDIKFLGWERQQLGWCEKNTTKYHTRH